MITSPPKLYLDTNHIINISKIQGGLPLGTSEMYRDNYVFIDRCIREAKCALIFNPCAPLEWVDGKATEETALELAEVFTEAESLYLAESDTCIYTSEVLEECKRIDPSASFPKLPTLHYWQKDGHFTPALMTIKQHVPDYVHDSTAKSSFPDQCPVVSIADFVTSALRWKEHAEKRIRGHNEPLSRDIALAGDQFKCFSKEQIVRWMKGFLQIDKILRIANPKAAPDDLLSAIDVSRCPATYLYISIWENLVRRKCQPQENDCDDFFYLPVIPYSDISLIETRLAGLILQVDKKMKTRVFCKPPDVVSALRRSLNTE
jgi:hypothetical protein